MFGWNIFHLDSDLCAAMLQNTVCCVSKGDMDATESALSSHPQCDVLVDKSTSFVRIPCSPLVHKNPLCNHKFLSSWAKHSSVVAFLSLPILPIKSAPPSSSIVRALAPKSHHICCRKPSPHVHEVLKIDQLGLVNPASTFTEFKSSSSFLVSRTAPRPRVHDFSSRKFSFQKTTHPVCNILQIHTNCPQQILLTTVHPVIFSFPSLYVRLLGV